MDDVHRSRPSKAHVRCSAVSVGFAVGRLTGTRGSWTADVDHSRPTSILRVLRALREKPDPSTRAVIDLNRSDLPESSNTHECPSVDPEGETAERVALGVGLPSWKEEGHGRCTSITSIDA